MTWLEPSAEFSGRPKPGEARVSAYRFVADFFRIPDLRQPVAGIILGSGLGGAADRLLAEGGASLEYSEIPGMPMPQVKGHAGRLIVGDIHGLTLVMLQGRVHHYEGHSPDAVIFGTRLLTDLGIQWLIVTNAAGGIREGFLPGDLMLIRDHIRTFPFRTFRDGTEQGGNTGLSGLMNSARTESPVWCPGLRTLAQQAMTPLRIHEGVYSMMPGPSYETPSEIRMLRTLGADAVGMSTIPEALFAANQGIRVLGVSCITNAAAGLSDQHLSHSDVTSTASSIEAEFINWLWEVIRLNSKSR